MMTNVLLILILICLGFALYWIGGVYYTIRKAANELIKGVNTLDQRLANLEALSAEAIKKDK